MEQASTRLHPIVAARAMRALLRDKEDTKQVFVLMDALRGKTMHRNLARFRQTPEGQRVLGEKRRLLDSLNDRAGLAALPAGTLGRAYHEFMAAENLSADGLVEASKVIAAKDKPAEELVLFRERNREMHDLLHLVTGYGRDPLGEACVVAFSFAQSKQLGFGVIALFGGLDIAKRLKDQPVKRAVFEAWRRGRAAGWLIGADWEALLSRPLDEIRAQYKVPPAHWYPKVRDAVRELATPGLQPQPAMAD